MSDTDRRELAKTSNLIMKSGFPKLLILSILALLLTFIISISVLPFITKLIVFIVVTVVYLILATAFFNPRLETLNDSEPEYLKEIAEERFSDDVSEKLLALEEANTIFGSTLKPADMFRLISNRINELITFSTSVLFLANKDKNKLRISYAFGSETTTLPETEIDSFAGVAGKSFHSGQIQISGNLSGEKSVFSYEALKNLKSAIACPLINEGEIYGVLTLYGDENDNFSDKNKKLLEAIGSRISPLFISSITFENNLNNALSDSLTNLPNERALFMMLENQVAESQRYREHRPLTVLSIDIKNFAQINTDYGHAAGDRVLNFAAAHIKEQLRQMDFLSRLAGDEFLVVLPTASDKTTEMIIERIKNTFTASAFTVTNDNKIFIELNFGAASFGTDGETAQDLIKISLIKKREAKSNSRGQILWFPKEFLH